MEFEIMSEPKAQKRHRLCRGRVYDPSKKDKMSFLEAATRYKPDEPMEDPLAVTLTFFTKRPASHFNKSGLKKNARRFPPKPDIDNLCKFVFDALNGVFYKDDVQIVELHSRKLYGEMYKTVVKIETR